MIFPPPELAEPSGLLAVGGDLRPERLVLAYAAGIFPWYDDDSPILWHSPDPRMVLLRVRGAIVLVDGQPRPAPLPRSGASGCPPPRFPAALEEALKKPPRLGPWRLDERPAEPG